MHKKHKGNIVSFSYSELIEDLSRWSRCPANCGNSDFVGTTKGFVHLRWASRPAGGISIKALKKEFSYTHLC